jgi:hypothetical protein
MSACLESRTVDEICTTLSILSTNVPRPHVASRENAEEVEEIREAEAEISGNLANGRGDASGPI